MTISVGVAPLHNDGGPDEGAGLEAPHADGVAPAAAAGQGRVRVQVLPRLPHGAPAARRRRVRAAARPLRLAAQRAQRYRQDGEWQRVYLYVKSFFYKNLMSRRTGLWLPQ